MPTSTSILPLAILLALVSSGFYGAADFLGGFATKRAPSLAVLVLSQLVSIATVLIALRVLAPATPRPADFGWGAAGGLLGGAGLVLFYKGLASGTMSVVAPVTGVAAIAVPVVVGLALGERPGPLALLGVVIAVVSIGCVSITVAPDTAGRRAMRAAISGRALASALLAGVLFGVFYVLIRNASPAAGLWPLLAARATSVAACTIAGVVTGRRLTAPRAVLPLIAWTGVLDMTANICYLLAVHLGMLSIVATLASLYPVVTLILARFVLGERLGVVQRLGLASALGAIVLISLG
jgi:drug/metabolite transporter (DMT)-like permease